MEETKIYPSGSPELAGRRCQFNNALALIAAGAVWGSGYTGSYGSSSYRMTAEQCKQRSEIKRKRRTAKANRKQALKSRRAKK